MVNNFLQENCKAQEWKMYNIYTLLEMDGSDEFCNSMTCKRNEIDFEVQHAQPHTKGNNSSQQKLAQPSFEVSTHMLLKILDHFILQISAMYHSLLL